MTDVGARSVDALIAWFRRRMPMSASEEALARECCRGRSATKGTMLQRSGEVATHGYFVVKGLIRRYSIDDKGREHTLRFAPEDGWITDFESLRDRTPASAFIETLEDCELAVIDAPSHERLIAGIAGYAAAFAHGLLKMSEARERRLLDSMSATAEERYLNFLETYAAIAQRIPQHMLASYLGMTPETLSRVRNQLAKKRRGATR